MNSVLLLILRGPNRLHRFTAKTKYISKNFTTLFGIYDSYNFGQKQQKVCFSLLSIQ